MSYDRWRREVPAGGEAPKGLYGAGIPKHHHSYLCFRTGNPSGGIHSGTEQVGKGSEGASVRDIF